MAIFCVGQAVYDLTVFYTGPLRANQKYRIASSHGCSGAPALNAACLCSLWGAPTQFIGRIGADAYGSLVRADLASCGVRTDYLIPDEDISTSSSLIAVDDMTGERTIFNILSSPRDIDYTVPCDVPDVILADGHEPEVSLALMGAHANVPSIVDAGTYRASVYEVAREADYLVCSEDFARQFTGETLDDPGDTGACDALLARIEGIHGGIAVITLGDRGLIYRDDAGAPRHMGAYPVRAVDTTGAGDVFHGAFAYGLYEGISLEENMRRCSMAAALSVCKMGGLTSIPALNEVLCELGRVKPGASAQR